MRKQRPPNAVCETPHPESPLDHAVTIERDTYDQSCVLTQAWCRETPTTDFQTQDPKPSLQKWGNFRHLEPTVRHPNESRHQDSWFRAGAPSQSSDNWENPRLCAYTRPRNLRATPGFLGLSVDREGLTSAYAELSTGQQSRSARPGAIRAAPIATA